MEMVFTETERGMICNFWKKLAEKAIESGAEFFVLLGDDVEVHTDDWVFLMPA